MNAPVVSQCSTLLDRIEGVFRRYVVMPEEAYLPVALWVPCTYLATMFDHVGFLDIHSPTKGCGKTTVFELLELLSFKPLNSTCGTLAYMFRKMADCPTLLIDEAEFLTSRSETSLAIKQMLNHGHRRGAKLGRCVGENNEPTQFNVYGPKAFASIGGVPDTVASRSIRIRMQKKLASDKVERLRRKRAEEESAPIRSELVKWVKESSERVEEKSDQMEDLDFVSSREADIWEPLFAICSVLAPDRIPELERCAKKLTEAKKVEESDDEPGTELLAYLRDEFWPTCPVDRAPTEMIIDSLREPDSPWYGVDLNGRSIARMLRPFGIRPRKLRVGKDNFRGYDERDFKAAYRCLPEQAEQAVQPA